MGEKRRGYCVDLTPGEIVVEGRKEKLSFHQAEMVREDASPSWGGITEGTG